MKTKLFKLFVVITLSGTFFVSCSSEASDDNPATGNQETSSEVLAGEILEEENPVIYIMPSPVEIATFLKNTGTKFNESLLNDENNEGKYHTTVKRAVNLGVYSSDLSYAALFGETQSALTLLGTVKKITEELSIDAGIDKAIVKKFEESLNNNEAIDIMSDIYLNVNLSLLEGENEAVKSITLAGAWVESFYLLTALYNESEQKELLKDRIIDQKLAYETVMQILNKNADDSDVKEFINELLFIDDIINRIQFETSEVFTVSDEKNLEEIIESETSKSISDENIDRLIEAVAKLRAKIIS